MIIITVKTKTLQKKFEFNKDYVINMQRVFPSTYIASMSISKFDFRFLFPVEFAYISQKCCLFMVVHTLENLYKT